MTDGQHVFLHGGGDDPAASAVTFGRFNAACHGRGPIALIVVAEDSLEAEMATDDYYHIFIRLGVSLDRLVALHPSPAQPLGRAELAQHQPSGVFVCGGLTPAYHAALCLDQEWLAYVVETGIPYGGTSAGAAIAAETAILGGWSTPAPRPHRPLIFSGAAEGLDRLTVSPGLGLVPFAIDVHAGQMGTLTRLIHAIDSGLAGEGWAIDESTQLHVNGAHRHVQGLGYAYRVVPGEGGVQVTCHTSPADLIDAFE